MLIRVNGEISLFKPKKEQFKYAQTIQSEYKMISFLKCNLLSNDNYATNSEA